MKNAVNVNSGTSETQSQVNEAIDLFFKENGSVTAMELILWEMLSDSLSNPSACIDHHITQERMYLYRGLKELLAAIEPVKYSSDH
ncbi:hypothetical protein [Dyadobacter crusticola]|uniref:hypothetical protein n=1 Tax=Dyadobacter crusticola TaxID=292407 RepID=UPI0004E1B1B3|nr:hypothetical protein [Dyadobacter crusticola]